jgi:phosphate-selective porin OprO and OprP
MEIRDLTLSGLKSCALLILSIGMLPTGTAAQTAPIERIEAIERQIRNLQTELQQLKDELGQAKQQLRQSRGEVQRAKEEARQAQQAAEQARQNAARAASAETQVTQAAVQVQAAAVLPPPPPGSGIKVDFPGGRPTISTSDGSISFAVGTQIQFDMGGYFQNPTATTQFPHLNDGVNLRRGRIFFNAKYGDFYAIITPGFRRLARRLADLVRSQPQLDRVQTGDRYRWVFQAIFLAL